LTLNRKSEVAVVLLLSLSITAGTLPFRNIRTAYADSLTIPPGILYYVPITLTNTQGSPTPSPFQEMLKVDSASYSAYEAPNLQNIEFFNSSGYIIPSWLESGNSNSSTNTVYWLRLAAPVASHAGLNLYMGFSQPSTNLFNTRTTGEAPQLSPTYGEYDDGASVFPFYQNFAGTSTPAGWVYTEGNNPGAYMKIDNGLTMGGASVNRLTSPIFAYDTEFNPLDYVIEFYAEAGGFQQGSPGGFPEFGWSASIQSIANPSTELAYSSCDTPGQLSLVVRTGGGMSGSSAYGNFSIQLDTYYVLGTYETIVGVFGEVNYGGIGNSTGFPLCSYLTPYWTPVNSSYIVYSAAETSSLQSDWVRLRTQPPNGIMPTEAVGALTSTDSIALTCSPSTVSLGSAVACEVQMTGSNPTGRATWSSSSAGTFSNSSCLLSSGSCQVSYTPLNATSPVTIDASYGGNSNNPPIGGTYQLTVSKATSTVTVSCSPFPAPVGSTASCTATVAGNVPSGIITWVSSGVMDFSPGPACNLMAHSCSVDYMPSSLNSPITITATYSGDQNNVGSTGSYSLAVVQSTSSTSGASSSGTKSGGSSGIPESGGNSGIPEFPGQFSTVALFVVLVIASYLFARRRSTLTRPGGH